MFVQAIRGAITVDDNTSEEILEKTKVLLSEIIKKNDLHYDEIISIIFTATEDLDSAYPAQAAREMGMTQVPLMCCQEMKVNGSLQKCIRVLVHVQKGEKFKPHHVYLNKAVYLRPDLIKESM